MPDNRLSDAGDRVLVLAALATSYLRGPLLLLDHTKCGGTPSVRDLVAFLVLTHRQFLVAFSLQSALSFLSPANASLPVTSQASDVAHPSTQGLHTVPRKTCEFAASVHHEIADCHATLVRLRMRAAHESTT